MNNKIDFATITACGECCVGCKKKAEGFVRAVLNLMVIVRNGRNRMDAQFINVQESIMFSFADCVTNFPASGL